MIAPSFYKRSALTTGLVPPPGLTFAVERFSHYAQGGPEDAVIRVTGGSDALWQLTNWARCGVKLANDAGEVVWWGYVSKITLIDGPVNIVVDVEQMTNACAVAYTLSAFGQGRTGARQTTDWIEDTASIIEFGRREILDSMGDTSAINAEAQRDRRLVHYKYPVALPTITPGNQAGDQSVTLECRGWWYTLQWRYATVPATLAFAYSNIGADAYYLGRDYNDDADNREAYAQAFDVGAVGWNLQEVDLYLCKVGSPAEDLTVSICENPDDETPGSSLGSATITALSVGTALAWTRATFDSPIALTAGTTYFLKVDTDGMNADNYYTFRFDAAQGYTNGPLRALPWEETEWVAVDADMPFRIYTNEVIENTEQIRALLVNYGQFINRIFVENAAGIATESYRNGDSDVQYEIEELLNAGTSAGLRLVAAMDEHRNVAIRAVSLSDNNTLWAVDRSGQFYYDAQKIDPSTVKAGFWCRLRGVVPANVSTTELSGLGTVWIERVEYDAAAGVVNYEPLGLADLWEATKSG